MSIVELKNKILSGENISREEAEELLGAPTEELQAAADEIREKMCGNGFDLCSIVNAKCGRCSEDCCYCAQSVFYEADDLETYGLLDSERLLEGAKRNASKGVLRYSIVTSGRSLSDREVDKVCESIRLIKENVNIKVCVSLGLLQEEAFRKLKEAGASRVHCNLEASESYFPKVCTTHTFAEKVKTIRAAQKAGLTVCSGGIMGLGETMTDRIDMAFALRNLGIKSVPVNFLNPIKGTPCENNKPLTKDEALRCIALFRFIIPDGNIRLAGGRGLMDDMGEVCFRGGANAAITQDMLTTSGITVENDMKIIEKTGYEVRLSNE